MVKRSFPMIMIIVVIINALSLQATKAQVPSSSELFEALKEKDSLLFAVGFNQCNLAQVESLLAQDLEFYHDQEGITSSISSLVASLKEGLCHAEKNRALRVLVDTSLAVFPLYDQGHLYGALQSGIHTFGNTTARFTHLWLLENDDWVVSRIISYDHQPTKPIITTDATSTALSSDSLSSYLGNYPFAPDFVLSIILEGDTLYGDAQGQKVAIKPIGNHQFIDESQQMQLYFMVSNEGTVTGLKMSGSNGEMIAPKAN
ncbi:DUF4440 domain-containing protein [Tunicatimonas pelagia]|uniref:DUF4440 domain-containing protein n=1 Tax=Tunicatimonas pelagia TaxID=931531 RepID=UPI002666ECAE|nr:DUF4440 domain-containing protein [Tunicatimonas pelagia]WKN43891.1 DUF4440 domain-containing protein [Tunicatimonas pelagia]